MIRQIDEGKRRFCRSLVGCGLGRVLEWPCASRAVLALSGAACVTGCSDVTLHADVVIVGGGGAGLAAAVSAAERKLSVILLEKEAAFGGNTAVSTGLFSAVDPVRQKRQGIEDSEELYAEQMLQSGRGKSDPKLVRTLAHEAPSTLCWLESMGMRFSDELIESYGSHWVRDHRPLTANGLGYVRVLVTKAMQLGGRFEDEFSRDEPSDRQERRCDGSAGGEKIDLCGRREEKGRGRKERVRRRSGPARRDSRVGRIRSESRHGGAIRTESGRSDDR